MYLFILFPSFSQWFLRLIFFNFQELARTGMPWLMPGSSLVASFAHRWAEMPWGWAPEWAPRYTKASAMTTGTSYKLCMDLDGTCLRSFTHWKLIEHSLFVFFFGIWNPIDMYSLAIHGQSMWMVGMVGPSQRKIPGTVTDLAFVDTGLTVQITSITGVV